MNLPCRNAATDERPKRKGRLVVSTYDFKRAQRLGQDAPEGWELVSDPNLLRGCQWYLYDEVP